MTVRLLAAFCVLALASPALTPAAAKNGVTPLTPKSGTTVEQGSRPLFKVRSTGKGTVWVVVSKSRKRDKEGVIKSNSKTFFKQAKRKSGSTFQVKASFFDFPEFWLNSPGTYYWQAFRIDCTGNLKDCKRESTIVKFRVG